MAEYTTQIRSIVEQLNNDHDFEPSSTDPVIAIDERIENARPHIFSFNYPILAADKARFEKNFIRHFYTREIGLETYSLWRLKLAAKLNMIIPKYNKYFEEATKYVDVNLLGNVDYQIIRDFDGNKNLSNTEVVDGTRTDNLSETTNGTNNGEVTRTDNLTENTNDDGTEKTVRTDNLSENNNRSGSETNNRDFVRAYSDTPQGNMQNLLDEKYLTNLTHEYENGSQRLNTESNTKLNTGTVSTDVDKTNDRVKTNTGTVTTESEETNSSTKRNTGTVDTDTTTTRTGTERDTQEENTHHVGKNGGMTYAEALLKARETYLNIDLMLCDELDDLFMQIW